MPFYLKDRDIFSDIAMVHSALMDFPEDAHVKAPEEYFASLEPFLFPSFI